MIFPGCRPPLTTPATARPTAGFTLIELVVVIVIVSVLAVYATSRFSTTAFRESGFLQQSGAALRYGQQLAISSGCDVAVSVDAGGCTVTWDDCGSGNPANGTPVSNPATGAGNFCANSESASVTGATVIFSSNGRPDAGANLSIGGRALTVEAETGYVH